MKTKGEKLAEKLGLMAPSELTPSTYEGCIKNLGIDYESFKTPGCTAVGLGSICEDHGRLLEFGNTVNPHVVLIGKGITFDSGGYSIKPSGLMHHMKFDMMGSANVLGAFIDGTKKDTLIELCIAENRISSRAILPGHVIKYVNGAKVVVENTDAEGRLVLADGILRAKQLGAKKLVTVATLTGAIVAALGQDTVGAFVEADEDWEAIRTAFKGAKIGVWRMPYLYDAVMPTLKRKGGVVSNHTQNRTVPGASVAASFLKHFAKDTPLIHLDIAGVAYRDEEVRIDMVKVLSKLSKIL